MTSTAVLEPRPSSAGSAPSTRRCPSAASKAQGVQHHRRELHHRGNRPTLSPATRAFVEERIRAIASRVAEGMRGEAEVKYEAALPP